MTTGGIPNSPILQLHLAPFATLAKRLAEGSIDPSVAGQALRGLSDEQKRWVFWSGGIPRRAAEIANHAALPNTFETGVAFARFASRRQDLFEKVPGGTCWKWRLTRFGERVKALLCDRDAAQRKAEGFEAEGQQPGAEGNRHD